MPIETNVAPTRIKEQRRHPRAQLNLPVRLRWPTPLGQTTEVAETLDVCRGGLLIHRRDPCPIRAHLWVTFPFDSTLPLTQPETPARIARVKTTPTGNDAGASASRWPCRSASARRSRPGPRRQ